MTKARKVHARGVVPPAAAVSMICVVEQQQVEIERARCVVEFAAATEGGFDRQQRIEQGVGVQIGFELGDGVDEIRLSGRRPAPAR